MTCVSSYVRGEMVRSAELPQTDAALEWFLSWEHYGEVSGGNGTAKFNLT